MDKDQLASDIGAMNTPAKEALLSKLVAIKYYRQTFGLSNAEKAVKNDKQEQLWNEIAAGKLCPEDADLEKLMRFIKNDSYMVQRKIPGHLRSLLSDLNEKDKQAVLREFQKAGELDTMRHFLEEEVGGSWNLTEIDASPSSASSSDGGPPLNFGTTDQQSISGRNGLQLPSAPFPQPVEEEQSGQGGYIGSGQYPNHGFLGDPPSPGTYTTTPSPDSVPLLTPFAPPPAPMQYVPAFTMENVDALANRAIELCNRGISSSSSFTGLLNQIFTGDLCPNDVRQAIRVKLESFANGPQEEPVGNGKDNRRRMQNVLEAYGQPYALAPSTVRAPLAEPSGSPAKPTVAGPTPKKNEQEITMDVAMQRANNAIEWYSKRGAAGGAVHYHKLVEIFVGNNCDETVRKAIRGRLEDFVTTAEEETTTNGTYAIATMLDLLSKYPPQTDKSGSTGQTSVKPSVPLAMPPLSPAQSTVVSSPTPKPTITMEVAIARANEAIRYYSRRGVTGHADHYRKLTDIFIGNNCPESVRKAIRAILVDFVTSDEGVPTANGNDARGRMRDLLNKYPPPTDKSGSTGQTGVPPTLAYPESPQRPAKSASVTPEYIYDLHGNPVSREKYLRMPKLEQSQRFSLDTLKELDLQLNG
jgi:hypothetical protein